MPAPELTGKVSDHLKIGVAAAGRGDLEAVTWLLEREPEWLTRIGSHGRTMLWEAAYRGKLAVVRYLADAGADIDALGCHNTPLRVEVSPYCAARVKRHRDVAEHLLGIGAVYDIHAAAYLGDVDAIDGFLVDDPSLLERGAPQAAAVGRDGARLVMDYVPTPWATPLLYAVCGRQPAAMQRLLALGADVRAHADTLMDRASKDASVLRILLDEGCDPSALPPPRDPTSEVGRLLVSYGALADIDHGAPLVRLCRGDRGGDPDEVLALIQRGADLSLADYKGRTALHNASRGGLLPAMRLLLEHGAAVDARDHSGETPLMHAIRASVRRTDRKVAAVAQLLDHHADPYATNDAGASAISIARRSRRPEKADILGLLEDASAKGVAASSGAPV